MCTNEPANPTNYSALMVVLNVLLIVAVLVICGIVLFIMRHRGLIYCTPKKTVGNYSPVIEPNRAELEWDDKDLEHIWSTSGNRREF